MPNIPPLCLTMGEPAGIGGEITLKAWSLRHEYGLTPFFLIDDPDRLTKLASAIGVKADIAVVHTPDKALSLFGNALPVLPLTRKVESIPGHLDTAHAASVIESIESAYKFVSTGAAAAMVTNPIQKSSLYAAGFDYPGHTEFLAALGGLPTPPVMMLVIEGLRVVPVTVHQSLRIALNNLTTEAIVTKSRITAEALRAQFGIAEPRLAIAGLNPHAGEDGAMGLEEIEIIQPAITILRNEGWHVIGPLSPDTMFHPRARAAYDVAICHYHDQALIPLKTIDYDHGVNVTLGLNFIRTSPDHGTALDIAGTGTANPQSLIAALSLAAKLARCG